MSSTASRRVSMFSTILVVLAASGLLIVAGCPTTPVDGQTGNSGVTGQYVGSERCSQCHVNLHTAWSKTLHAGALKTLEDAEQDTNSACLPCHTVGYGKSGGFIDRATTNVLADVGCECCHGPARDHVDNVNDRSKDPSVTIASSLCGTCHTGSHHPTIDEWEESSHATVLETVAEELVAGDANGVQNCGVCHSGDVNYAKVIMEDEIADDAFVGMDVEDLNGITCAICHDPHAKTNNAADPDEGRDFQLRYAEIASPTATNTIVAATDTTRFNLCGQCHHSRGRDWSSTSRGPHHSVQVNMLIGEMPVPVGTSALVPSKPSVHGFAPEQCSTCHMYRQDFESEEAPAIAGHTFQTDFDSCTTACHFIHSTKTQAEGAMNTLKQGIQDRLDKIEERLDDWGDWKYSAEGGPADQSGIPDEIKKVRFLKAYVESDGSLGMHNPGYIADILTEAENLLTSLDL